MPITSLPTSYTLGPSQTVKSILCRQQLSPVWSVDFDTMASESFGNCLSADDVIKAFLADDVIVRK